jgi:hypothetical protein|tara:strand:+ start:1174 stop:1494 length:321 start_codon:yes stop_codon:yes gene_type:complete
MNYNIPKEELKECLSTYLFKLSKFEKGIDNNSELLKEFKDVANIEQANIFIDINNLIYNNSIKFINSEIIKVLEGYYQTNVESFKFYKQNKLLVADFGHDFEQINL